MTSFTSRTLVAFIWVGFASTALAKPNRAELATKQTEAESAEFESISTRAKAGEADAQYQLGLRCYEGNGVPKNFSEAAKWYLQAADQGLAAAQVALARCYFFGEGVPKDFNESVNWSRKAAEQNDPLGENLLGLSYSRGDGVVKDVVEAAKWFRKAADQGFAKAQFNLAKAYERGNGVAREPSEAVNWYRKAAEQGLAPAQGALGRCYANGTGTTADIGEAVKWFRKAAEQNDVQGQYSLGLLYARGQGVPRDAVEAAHWFRKAAEHNLALAQYSLGGCYYNGEGVRKNFAEAVKCYRKAADQNYAPAQFELGVCCERGEGVAKNQVEAVKWYRKAAEQNYVPAQFNLGFCYKLGLGVTSDSIEAVKWLRKAAEQNNAWAQLNLGLCYYYGDGVAKDYVESYKWMLLAAGQGNQGARDFVTTLENSMSREQIAEGQRLASNFKPRQVPVAGSMSDATILKTRPESSGSGFFITDDGFLVTNEHVVKDAVQIRLVCKAGLIAAKVLKTDPATDLALLKAEGKFAALPVAASRTVHLGGTVLTVGFPNVGLQGFAPKLARGEIASLSGSQDDARYFQISVPVQPGNSGGALVDEHGNVVGIVSAALSAKAALATSGSLPQSVNYAVKSSFLLGFLESVPELAAKLKEPNAKDMKFDEVVEQAKQAAVLVLVY